MKLPEGRKFALEPFYEMDAKVMNEHAQNLVGWRSYVVVDPPALDDRSFAGVRPAEAGQIELTLIAGSPFTGFTRANIGKRIALVVSEDILAAPVVHQVIEGGVTVPARPIPDGTKRLIDVLTRKR